MWSYMTRCCTSQFLPRSNSLPSLSETKNDPGYNFPFIWISRLMVPRNSSVTPSAARFPSGGPGRSLSSCSGVRKHIRITLSEEPESISKTVFTNSASEFCGESRLASENFFCKNIAISSSSPCFHEYRLARSPFFTVFLACLCRKLFEFISLQVK